MECFTLFRRLHTNANIPLINGKDIYIYMYIYICMYVCVYI